MDTEVHIKSRSGWTTTAMIVAGAVMLLSLFLLTPQGRYARNRVMRPVRKQLFYYQDNQKAYARIDQCTRYEENPAYYLKTGKINQQQYNYIMRQHYMASCDTIMALRTQGKK